MRKLFGTDGVRGVANTELSALLALQLGAASAYVLRNRHSDARMLIGRDPRVSGDILESAMASGICSLGVDVYLAGVVATPGVAHICRQMHADAGIVISASHNPMQDNGIKFFGGDGYKLPDEVEAEIEEQIKRFGSLPRPTGNGVGRMYRAHELVDDYRKHLMGIYPYRMDGVRMILDCANGAVSETAPRLFSDLGADIEVVNNTPDGVNINSDCGSLHPETLMRQVKETGAQLGLAFDGDGDRAILVDDQGRIVDGDHVMAICGLHMASRGMLPHNAVVATVMSNIGLEVALTAKGISLVRTKVGDRYVCDEMRKTGIAIGGEKSGHVIFSEHSTTGDGMLTALQVLRVMHETGKPLSELAEAMQEFPQVLINVPVREKSGWDSDPGIIAAIKAGEERLGNKGRVFVRPSGTEKLIRVMAEGPDLDELHEITDEICGVVKKILG